MKVVARDISDLKVFLDRDPSHRRAHFTEDAQGKLADWLAGILRSKYHLQEIRKLILATSQFVHICHHYEQLTWHTTSHSAQIMLWTQHGKHHWIGSALVMRSWLHMQRWICQCACNTEYHTIWGATERSHLDKQDGVNTDKVLSLYQHCTYPHTLQRKPNRK